MAFLQGLDSHVVIVGCGMSGLGAALRLVQHGFHNVRVVEASDRAGGRIKTALWGGKFLEIGANWIHGPCQENPVFRLACNYGLLDEKSTTEENQSIDVDGHPPFVPNWFSSSGRKVSVDLTKPAAMVYMSLLQESQGFFAQDHEHLPARSVGEFIKSKALEALGEEQVDKGTKELRLAVVNTLLKAECCVSGTHTMDDVCLKSFGMYKTLPGLDCTFPGGYEGLIRCMIQDLPKDIVSYNKPVKCIHWNCTDQKAKNSGKTFPVLVECDDGETIPADHVILTVSLGVLKRKQKTLLSPEMPPQKVESIQNLGFGTNNKIFLEFEEPFWEPDCEIIFFLWEDETELSDVVSDLERFWMKKLFGFTVMSPAERYGHMLCGWIAGCESEYMEALSQMELESAVTQLIRRFTGNPTITPKRVLRSQWYHDPYTYGSYTYVAKGCCGQDIENLAEPLPLKGSQSKPLQVLFGGEATSQPFFSTVHGALLAGWREAERIISHYAPLTFPETGGSKL
ncbi:peroxisomal N(1)-acetyl-spermine/spermidine oxidase [Scleropages formosus]|uniref:Polyamine oxidase n=1 Tax=Scleropages formosus TaxID=113540 RepID=A0A8C9S8F8_SCLFO|nr:peroxisomal N(1)-acetyl-spermine/spermidine oxidase [Scleropages formosus]